MAKLSRMTPKIFGETATASGDDPQIGQFGSALAGTYIGTTDLNTIQALPAWSNGFIDAVTPTTQFPPLPEMTGVMKVLSHQNAYLYQQGVAEWDSATTYYINQFCAYNGIIYKSLQDDNLNKNPSTQTSYWSEYGTTSGDFANKSLSNLNSTGENRVLPSQSGNHNKLLTTNGTSPSWVAVDYANQSLSNLNTTGERRVLPSQSGYSGRYLTTNGTSPYWTSAPVPVVNYSAGINVTSSAYASSGTGYKPSSNGFLLIAGGTGSGSASSNIVTYLYIYNSSGVTVLDQARIGGANVGTSDAITLMVNSNYSYRVYPMRSVYTVMFYPYY